jgi:hypothetical protein
MKNNPKLFITFLEESRKSDFHPLSAVVASARAFCSQLGDQCEETTGSKISVVEVG